ncbi:MAG: hypothetical protein ABIR91_04340 [Candidatus Saccharimonadales bacterium]
MNHRLTIGRIEHTHSRDEVFNVIESGRLVADDPSTVLSPQDEFIYRHSLVNDSRDDFTRLERFMLSMYGRSYFDSPELIEAFYKDTETRSRQIGEIALFANLCNESGLSAVTIGFLGDTGKYPPHVRLNAQSANFNNTMGLSGLTHVRLETYQRVVKDQEQEVDLLRSVVTNTFRWNPFIVEHIKIHDDLRTVVQRKDMRVGEREIKDWAETHPEWQKYVEGTVRAVQVGAPNPIIDFWVPEGITDLRAAMGNLASFERLLDFEHDDDL